MVLDYFPAGEEGGGVEPNYKLDAKVFLCFEVHKTKISSFYFEIVSVFYLIDTVFAFVFADA